MLIQRLSLSENNSSVEISVETDSVSVRLEGDKGVVMRLILKDDAIDSFIEGLQKAKKIIEKVSEI